MLKIDRNIDRCGYNVTDKLQTTNHSEAFAGKGIS